MRTQHEQRRHPRIFFSPTDGVTGTVSFLNLVGESDFTAGVLDLSESGIGFSLRRGTVDGLKAGDQLYLEEVVGAPDLEELVAVTMQVRWVIDHEILGHVGVGCEFINLPESVKDQIRTIVAQHVD